MFCSKVFRKHDIDPHYRFSLPFQAIMMARQHGANLFNGTYYSERKSNVNTGKTNFDTTNCAPKNDVIEKLKVFRDKATFKQWRDGITGGIQFSVMIVPETYQDEEENSIQHISCGQYGCTNEHSDCQENTLNHNMSNTSYSNTPTNFLCLEIEKCFDLRVPTVTLISKRRIFDRSRSGPLLCPFVLIKLNNREIGRTPALTNTRNPIWFDECYRIPICDKCRDLTLEVWEAIPPRINDTKGTFYEQQIGDFIGKASLDIDSITSESCFQEFHLPIHRWGKECMTTHEQLDCFCPFQQINQYSEIINGDTNDFFRRETVRVKATGNSFRSKRRRLPSILVEKPGSSKKYSFKVKNLQPFRRKDIHEQSTQEDKESFLKSTVFKSILLMGVYLMIGVVGFSFTFQRWSIRDAVYFSVVTFSTVGFGDIKPDNDGAKLFTCVFALIGIGIIGIALGFIGQNLVHAQIVAFQRSQKVKDERKSERKRLLESFPLFRNIILFISPIVVMTLLGSMVVGSVEKWSWIDSVYWCVMTGTSVGYGDFVPRSNEMIWFSVIFIPLSVGCTSAALGKIANIFVEKEIAKANSKLLKREVTLEDLEVMNADGDGEVSLLEFVEYMLKVMHKVDQGLLDELHVQFEKLDADGSGGLQQDDLVLLTARKLTERREQAMKRYNCNLLVRDFEETKLGRKKSNRIFPNS